MPAFHLDMGSSEGANQYQDLDAFTQGYVQAMFFTDTGDQENEELENASFEELAPEALAGIIKDCRRFQEENRKSIDLAVENCPSAYDDERAGMDFWYTRNHHGVGYWDRQLGEVGDVLTTEAQKWHEVYIYRGDDGQIYTW